MQVCIHARLIVMDELKIISCLVRSNILLCGWVTNPGSDVMRDYVERLLLLLSSMVAQVPCTLCLF